MSEQSAGIVQAVDLAGRLGANVAELEGQNVLGQLGIACGRSLRAGRRAGGVEAVTKHLQRQLLALVRPDQVAGPAWGRVGQQADDALVQFGLVAIVHQADAQDALRLALVDVQLILSGGIELLANNLTLLMGIVQTLTAAKISAWLGNWIAQVYAKIAADQAARAAAIAAAEADLARATASGAQALATKAGILVAREEALARLSQAQANILAARAAIEAATAAGAQSFALRTLRLATAELAAAEAARRHGCRAGLF